MNLNDLQTKLLAAARQNAPSDQAPYAFEKRIMARLAGLQPQNVWELWGGSLWRAVVPCIAVTALCWIWSLSAPRPVEKTADLSQDLEMAVFANSSQPIDDVW